MYCGEFIFRGGGNPEPIRCRGRTTSKILNRYFVVKNAVNVQRTVETHQEKDSILLFRKILSVREGMGSVEDYMMSSWDSLWTQ